MIQICQLIDIYWHLYEWNWRYNHRAKQSIAVQWYHLVGRGAWLIDLLVVFKPRLIGWLITEYKGLTPCLIGLFGTIGALHFCEFCAHFMEGGPGPYLMVTGIVNATYI